MVKITIGSDPEFLIVDKHGELVPADHFFADCDKCSPCDTCGKEKDTDECGKCESDDCWLCNVCRGEPTDCTHCENCKDELMESAIGTDGMSDVGELRPCEAFNPLTHHATITGLIRSIGLPKGYKLVAGTVQDGMPLGGHIHIGFDEGEVGHEVELDSLASYLSYYCGIPLRRIEKRNDLYERGLEEGEYGYFGACEDKCYGIEWRMPASWLVSSVIAKSALCLAYVVANEFINMEDPEFMCVSHDEYEELLMASDINTIIEKIKSMEEYSTYANEIEPLFIMIEKGHVWYVNTNMKEVW